ncbi:unnamed protein product [Protopolystoma xenopodis]|uniref:Uncharacterized protein n=1 Tax=Protopolystoma xenopodis TaxID=117903 RepID=A0A3S5A4D8_9PLAT|nr:unnamed protein product [Protopolystoma xenopodis]
MYGELVLGQAKRNGRRPQINRTLTTNGQTERFIPNVLANSNAPGLTSCLVQPSNQSSRLPQLPLKGHMYVQCSLRQPPDAHTLVSAGLPLPASSSRDCQASIAQPHVHPTLVHTCCSTPAHQSANPVPGRLSLFQCLNAASLSLLLFYQTG